MTVYNRMMLLSEKPEKQGTILDQVQRIFRENSKKSVLQWQMIQSYYTLWCQKLVQYKSGFDWSPGCKTLWTPPEHWCKRPRPRCTQFSILASAAECTASGPHLQGRSQKFSKINRQKWFVAGGLVSWYWGVCCASNWRIQNVFSCFIICAFWQNQTTYKHFWTTRHCWD